MFLTEEHPLVVVDEAVTYICQGAAAHADGVDLRHLVGDGEQVGYRSEGLAEIVHVETGDDDAHTAVGELVAYVGKAIVEKLCLVDAHNVDIAAEKEYLGRRIDRCRRYHVMVVADNIVLTVARVDHGLVNLNTLARKLGTLHTADKFLRLAGEHAATNNLYTSASAALSMYAFFFFHTETAFFQSDGLTHNVVGQGNSLGCMVPS